MLRRTLYAFIIVFCGSSIVLQVLAIDVLCTLLIAFYITVGPMIDKANNFIQIFNEVIVLVSLWMMFRFTYFVADAYTRYDLAWQFLYLLIFNVAINVLFLIVVIIKKI